MARARLTLAVAALLPLLAAGCSFGPSAPPQQFAPLHYEYLTKIRLDVARIDIDTSWAPRGGDRHVEYLSPVQPLDALREMVNDRLVAGGGANQAVVAIEDASIVRRRSLYQATFAVRLEVLDNSGARLRGAAARVSDAHPVTGDSTAAVRADLYALTRQAMDDMNVEFEYQIRRGLNVQMLPTSPAAPAPAPVGAEDLGPPGSAPPPSAAPDQGMGLPLPTPLAPPPPASFQPPPVGQPLPDQPPPDQAPPDQPPGDDAPSD